MHGTFDHEKLAVWVRLLTKLVDYVVRTGTKSVRKMISGFDHNSDLFGLMVDIFGQQDVRQFNDISYRVIEEAVSNTKLAFMKTSVNNELASQRKSAAEYFKG
jgi:hypothetical protein